jgi:hypothetical protein
MISASLVVRTPTISGFGGNRTVHRVRMSPDYFRKLSGRNTQWVRSRRSSLLDANGNSFSRNSTSR